MKLTDVISKKVIEAARAEGACDEALEYVTAKPRTYDQLYKKNRLWLQWLTRFTTIPTVLNMLALHTNPTVRRYVTYNSVTSKAVIKKLSKDESSAVRDSAVDELRYRALGI